MNYAVKYLLAVFMISLCPFFSWAGIVKENGGNTVICEADDRLTAELLDFYEASRLPLAETFHFDYWMHRSEREALKFVIQTIGHVRGEDVGNQYKEWFESFTTEANFVAGAELGTVIDSYHFLIPRNCEVVQTVLQIEPIFHEARYTINADAWKLLRPLHQVGLIVHELIYRDLNPQDSRIVRLITAFLFSDEIQQMSIEEQKAALLKLGFTGGLVSRNKGPHPN